jgi:other hect domain ubiquitin protein ligase E3
VYSEYFFNAEAIPIYQQAKCVSKLPCTVYLIPQLWNVTCWLVDTLTSALIQEKNSLP